MTARIAYQTDNSGLYAGKTEADESPLEPGVYLVPAGAVLLPVPAAWPDDKWPRWNGVEWALVNKPQRDPVAAPVAKLQAFLAANPDVAAVLNNDGGANV